MLDPSFFSYVTVMSITPGPNNLMLATSGVNFGMRRTVPMMFGITIGCALQIAIAALLLDSLLLWMGAIRLPLTLLGCTYLLWLAWKIFRADAPELREKARPVSLLSGALLQVVNPKAWLMATNVALIYSASCSVLPLMSGFAVLNLPCILIWAMMGDRLGRHLQVAWKLKAFNSVMALSLVVTIGWMLVEVLKP